MEADLASIFSIYFVNARGIQMLAYKKLDLFFVQVLLSLVQAEVVRYLLSEDMRCARRFGPWFMWLLTPWSPCGPSGYCRTLTLIKSLGQESCLALYFLTKQLFFQLRHGSIASVFHLGDWPRDVSCRV